MQLPSIHADHTRLCAKIVDDAQRHHRKSKRNEEFARAKFLLGHLYLSPQEYTAAITQVANALEVEATWQSS